MLLKYSRKALLSLKFWWKSPNILLHSDQPSGHKIQPVLNHLWMNLKSYGILKPTRSKRGGSLHCQFKNSIPVLSSSRRQSYSKACGSIGWKNLLNIPTTTKPANSSSSSTKTPIPLQRLVLPKTILLHDHGLSIPTRVSNRHSTFNTWKIPTNKIQSSNTINLINIQICHPSSRSEECKSQLPRIYLTNTRSLVNKMEDLETTFCQNNVEIACITETWLNKDIRDSAVNILNFSLTRRDRETGRGGGVCAYVKEHITFSVLSEYYDPAIESLWLYTRPHKLPRGFSCLIIGIIYHPPSTSSQDDQLMIYLTLTVDSILSKYPNAGLMITGDFNRAKHSMFTSRFSLKQIVKGSTRNQATLDLVFTNLNKLYTLPAILPPVGLSDHNGVLVLPNNVKSTNMTRKIQYRKVTPSSKNAMKRWLLDFNWNELYLEPSCEIKCSIFYNVLGIALDSFCPPRTVKFHSTDRPWVTSTFKRLIAERQKAFVTGNQNEYNRIRNTVNNMSKQLKSVFFKNKVKHLKAENPRKWWKSIKQLAGDTKGKQLNSIIISNNILCGQELATKINDAFLTVTEDLTPLQPIQAQEQELEPPNINFRITEKEVFESLSRIKIFKAPGPDLIPNWLLKDFALELCGPVTSLFTSSLQQACVPSYWKCADVIPIPKVAVVKDVQKDLRPISLTPTLSKLMERFISNWILKAIKNKLDRRQFGSLKGTSTTQCLLSMLHHWLQDTDGNGKTIRIFLLDFSKAFDLIDHKILLSKLQSLDLHQSLIAWVQNFLTCRRQRVRIGQKVSEWKFVNGGVPQGTILGPILFLVMINDLGSEWNNRWKYVDDSSLSETIDKGGESQLQQLLLEIHNWTKRNNMKLNIDKCKELVICFAKNQPCFPPLVCADQEVKTTKSAKILGLTLTNNLTWNEHIREVVKKSSRRLFMLRTLKRAGIETATMLTVYKTCIRPVLEYAAPVWHYNLPKYLSDEIEMIQKRALRIIFPHSSYEEALVKSELQLLNQRRLTLCKSTFKSISSNPLSLLVDIVPPKRQMMTKYNLRNEHGYQTTRCKTNRFQKSFIPSSIINWNNSLKN